MEENISVAKKSNMADDSDDKSDTACGKEEEPSLREILHTKLTLYNCLIIPLFDYGDTVWGDKNNNTLMGQLQVLQNKAAKVLLNLPPRSSSTEALDRLDLKPLLKRRHFHRCIMMQKYLLGEIDFKFDVRRNSSFHSYLKEKVIPKWHLFSLRQ